jgi:esterase/lipase
VQILFKFTNFILVGCLVVACGKGGSGGTAAPGKDAKEVTFQECLSKIDQYSKSYMRGLERSYARIDKKYFHEIPAESRTLFLKGKRGAGAVLLMHGILSSPAAMALLAKEFNKQGMTVLSPLIASFGATVAVANSSSVSNWQYSLDTHYKMLSNCFDDIALVGFSLGGALSADFTLNRYPKLYREKKVATMSSLLLLSPAIKPSESFVPLKAGVTLIFSDSVPFWLISKLKNDADIKEMMKHPEKYNQYFPVYVGTELHKLANILEDKSAGRFDAHPLQVSLDYSQGDTATDWQDTRKFLTDHFFDVRIFSYVAKDKVPHTLNLGIDNSVGNQIREGLARFIAWRHNQFQLSGQ